MPNYRQLPLLLVEAEKVVHQGIHHPGQQASSEGPTPTGHTEHLPNRPAHTEGADPCLSMGFATAACDGYGARLILLQMIKKDASPFSPVGQGILLVEEHADEE